MYKIYINKYKMYKYAGYNCLQEIQNKFSCVSESFSEQTTSGRPINTKSGLAYESADQANIMRTKLNILPACNVAQLEL